jgi:hypothetical protein
MLRQWSIRLVSIVGTQAFCHLLNGLAAILVVWLLPREQYAWFTLAASVMAVLQVLTDGGVNAAVLSTGGQVWQNSSRLSALVAAGIQVNRTLTTGVVIGAVPLLCWMMARQGGDWPLIISITLLCMIPQWTSNRAQIHLIACKLKSHIADVQAAELALAVARLALTLMLWFLGLAHAAWALAAVSASLVLHSWLVKTRTQGLLSPQIEAADLASFRQQIGQTVRHLYPGALFTCVQAHLAVWLLSFMGRSGELADIGALSRLGFFVNLAGAPLVTLAAPAFARCQTAGRLRSLFGLTLAGSAAFMLPLVCVAWWRPGWLLGLLGSGYAHLHQELLIVALGFMLAALANVCSHLNLARGWTRHFWLSVPLSLLAQLGVVFTVDLGTLAGMAWLGFALAAANLTFHGLLMLISLLQMPATSTGKL